MSVRCLGLCGVDESVDVELLKLLSFKHPSLEIGVLFREGKESTPRFPGTAWIDELCETAENSMPPMKLAAHLCGRRCSDLLNHGDTAWILKYVVPRGFRRVQVNATACNGVEVKDFAAAAANLREAVETVIEVEWIIQANQETRGLWEPFLADATPPSNLSILFDESAGQGKTIASFNKPPANGIPCGYAGGLGPHNIVSVMRSLRDGVARGHVIWLDMESKLRSMIEGNDCFDICKAQAVCKAVHLEGWETDMWTDITPPPPPPANTRISGHPLLAHKMTLLRDRTTPVRDFRQLLREITFHVGYEATANLLTAPRLDVVTPCGPLTGSNAVRLAESVALIPVMRAGLGMVDAMLELLPNAVVHHIGMFRTHGGPTSHPIEYYSRLPKDKVSDLAIILEPMVAHGQTAHAVISQLKGWGARRIVLLSVCASHQGLCKLQHRHPDVCIYTAQVDHKIRPDGWIVPGMGDAGDRQFGTPLGMSMSDDLCRASNKDGAASPTRSQAQASSMSPQHRPVTKVLGRFSEYLDPDAIPSPELQESFFTALTTHDGSFGVDPVLMQWGASSPEQRGPVLATRRHPKQRNAIGAHSGGYCIYRALAVVSAKLDIEYIPKLGLTTPVARIGPFDSWHDPKRIVTIDPYGHAVSEGFAPWLEKGYDIRPTIAITKAHIELPECREALRDGRLQADGNVLTKDGQSFVTKVAIEPVWYLPGIAERFGVTEGALRESLFKETNSMYPELLTRRDLKLFLPPIGGMTVYIWGDPELIPDESVELTVRVHDECNGSDVFGSDICTCRPYLTHAIEECIRTAQNGGTGVCVYFRKEGRALGEVTKYLVYNMRKRQEGGDQATQYFNCTFEVAGVTDTRFQVLMPDVLHWLGITKIHRFISMSDMKHDAIVSTGIKIEERVEIPPEMVPSDAHVEIAAKVFAGYHSGKSFTAAKDAENLNKVKGREYTKSTDFATSIGEGSGATGM